MKTRLFGLLLIATLGGCAGGRSGIETGRTYSACGIEIVFAQSDVSYAERAGRQDAAWVPVDVTVSLPGYDFGYLSERGEFVDVFAGQEGSFEVGGGQRLYLALRESGGQHTVYDVEKRGVCSVSGTRIAAKKAVVPRLDTDYFSSAAVSFDIPGGTEVTATLSTVSPNGFTLITD